MKWRLSLAACVFQLAAGRLRGEPRNPCDACVLAVGGWVAEGVSLVTHVTPVFLAVGGWVAEGVSLVPFNPAVTAYSLQQLCVSIGSMYCAATTNGLL